MDQMESKLLRKNVMISTHLQMMGVNLIKLYSDGESRLIIQMKLLKWKKFVQMDS